MVCGWGGVVGGGVVGIVWLVVCGRGGVVGALWLGWCGWDGVVVVV